MLLYQKDDMCHFIFAIPFPMEGITLGNGIVYYFLLKFLFMSISFSITSKDCAFTRSLEISLTIACVEGATQLNFWLAFKECTRGTLCVRMCPQNFALSANKTGTCYAG